MKLQLLVPRFGGLRRVFGIASLTALGLTAIVSQPSEAQSNRFFCGTSKDDRGRTVPATMVSLPGHGNVPMILWVSNGDLQGSPRERCQVVSRRFQIADENGTLKFIRAGNFKQYPVLCVANVTGGGDCPQNRVIVTLKPGTNPNTVFSQLINTRRFIAGKPVRLSGGDTIFYVERYLYVDVDKFLKALTDEDNSSSSSLEQSN